MAIVALIIALPGVSVAQQKPLANTANKEAEIAFKQGLEAFEKKDFKGAIDSFTNAIKLDDKFGEAYYYRARVRHEVPWFLAYTRVGDYDSAVKLNPNHADAYLGRGMSRPSTDKSAIDDDFSAAIRISPDFAEAYYRRAVNRADEALGTLRGINSGDLKEETLKSRGVLGMNVQNMGEAIARLSNQIHLAIPDLTRATELNPRDIEARSYLARLYDALGEYDKAITELTRVLSIAPDSADAYFARGLAYLGLKDYAKANQDFTAAISLRPDDTKAYNKRVVARFGLNDFEGALKDYVEVLRLEPNQLYKKYEDRTGDARIVTVDLENFRQILPRLTAAVRARLASAYYERGLANHYLRYWGYDDELEKAVADFTAALTLQTSDVAARHERGLVLLELGLYARAFRDFSDEIHLRPQNAEAFYARGMSRRSLRDYKGALKDFSRSIQLSPRFTKAHYERGRVYSELGNQRSAIADFTRAIDINSELIDAYYSRALAHQLLGENQKAITDYLEVVRRAKPSEKIENDHTDQLGSKLATVFHRGVARLRMARIIAENESLFPGKAELSAKTGYLESAQQDFTHVISLYPQFANAYYQRGRARRISDKEGDKEGALADFTRAIELNPNYADAYFTRAEYLESAWKLREAIQDLMRVTQLEPGNSRAFYNLGHLHIYDPTEKPADHKAALVNYSAAIRADPSYIEAYFGRAHVLAKTDALGAIADYTKIIQLDPENARAYRLRAAIYTEMKDYRSALADYTRAIELDPSEPGSDDRGAAHTFANRAYVRFELGDGKGALEDYRQALIIRPCLYCVSGSSSVSQANKADVFFQKGLALLRRGDKSASRQNLEEAARLFYALGDMPKYQSVKYHLSRF